jgi:hypothetical protein
VNLGRAGSATRGVLDGAVELVDCLVGPVGGAAEKSIFFQAVGRALVILWLDLWAVSSSVYYCSGQPSALRKAG